jgi:hypothetical protein
MVLLHVPALCGRQSAAIGKVPQLQEKYEMAGRFSASSDAVMRPMCGSYEVPIPSQWPNYFSTRHSICICEARPIESGRSGIGPPFEVRVANYVFDPKLPHHALHILGPEAISIGMFVAELTQARDPRIGIAWVRRKGRIGRPMNDALGSNIELVAPD